MRRQGLQSILLLPIAYGKSDVMIDVPGRSLSGRYLNPAKLRGNLVQYQPGHPETPVSATSATAES
jgi:hypothetical protein